MTEPPRLAYSPSEAAQALGISRARLYQLLDDGTIPSVKLGRRRLIRVAALQQLLDGLDEAERVRAVVETERLGVLQETMPEIAAQISEAAISRAASVLGRSPDEIRRMAAQPARDQL